MARVDFTPKSDEILYVPIGGAGQIGMNLYMYGHAGQWIAVDCGISFAHDGIPGIEVMMPDPEFVLEHRDNLQGLVITHAHEDHIGAIPYIIEDLGCPVYATRFTAAMIRSKLEESGLHKKIKVHVLPENQPFDLGKFGLEFVPLTHSIPESNALYIKTPVGNIFHTGDWKIDPRPLISQPINAQRLKQIGNDKVLALVCDSTNVFEEGHSGSEAEAKAGLSTVIAAQKNKVAVTLFASNVARMQSIAEAAAANDRHVALIGRSLQRVYGIATELGIIREFPNLVADEEASQFPDDKILYMCTGCQGERRSALARIADETHPIVRLHEGDTVIFSSREIPGNELAIQAMQNALARQGVHIITPSHIVGEGQENVPVIHVSGHPYKQELLKMYEWIRPQIAIPMHGELRHLIEHKYLADENGITQSLVVENGHIVSIKQRGAEAIGQIDCQALGLDGEQWVPLSGSVIKERHKFTWNGAMVISVAIGGKKDGLVSFPVVSLLGVVEKEDIDDLSDLIADKVEKTVIGLSRSDKQDDDAAAEKIRLAAQRVVQDYCGKKPLGRVHILRV